MKARVGRAASLIWLWWIDELTSMMPSGLRRWVQPHESSITVSFGVNSVLVGRNDAAESNPRHRIETDTPSENEVWSKIAEELGKIRQGGERVAITPPPEAVLRRIFKVPRAAIHNLETVIGYEIENLTPFSLNEVNFDYQIVQSSSTLQQLSIDAAMITKETTNALYEKAQEYGLAPFSIEFQESITPRPVPFVFAKKWNGEGNSRVIYKANLVLAGLCLLLLSANIYLPMARSQAEITRLDETLRQLAEQPGDHQVLQKRIDTLLQQRQFVTKQREVWVPVTPAIEKLTQVMPDNAWVMQFSMREARIDIQGFAENPQTLSTEIETEQNFGNVKFEARVSGNRTVPTQKLQYRISFDVIKRD